MFVWNNIYFSDKRGWCVFATCILLYITLFFMVLQVCVQSPSLHYISIVNHSSVSLLVRVKEHINLCKFMGRLSYHYTFMRPPYATTLHIQQYTSMFKEYLNTSDKISNLSVTCSAQNSFVRKDNASGPSKQKSPRIVFWTLQKMEDL